MGSKWTVAPATVRVELEILGEPCWLTLKRELSIGEQRRANTAGFRGMTGFGKDAEGEAKETEIGIDWRGQTFARTMEWLVDWSLTDDEGNKLKVSRPVVEALRQDVYGPIEQAINAHVEALEKEKKATGTA